MLQILICLISLYKMEGIKSRTALGGWKYHLIFGVTSVTDTYYTMRYNITLSKGSLVAHDLGLYFSYPVKDRIMSDKTVFINDLIGLVDSLPPDSILSRTVYEDKDQKVILFGFQPEQELSEHTASVPAVLHFLKGEADLTLGGDQQLALEGSWARIPANLPHSIKARSETFMLLTLNTSHRK